MHFMFHMRLENSHFLVEGRLILVDDEGLRETFIATSGCAGYQGQSGQTAKGKGPIPSCTLVNLKQYQVTTTPMDLPQIPGVAGAFYPISPANVAVDGIMRGDFGIHFDANVPGSAGCVVLRTQRGWQALQRWMKQFDQQGVMQVPLIVSYSY